MELYNLCYERLGIRRCAQCILATCLQCHIQWPQNCAGCRKPYGAVEAEVEEDAVVEVEEDAEVEAIASHRPDGARFLFETFWAGYETNGKRFPRLYSEGYISSGRPRRDVGWAVASSKATKMNRIL